MTAAALRRLPDDLLREKRAQFNAARKSLDVVLDAQDRMEHLLRFEPVEWCDWHNRMTGREQSFENELELRDHELDAALGECVRALGVIDALPGGATYDLFSNEEGRELFEFAGIKTQNVPEWVMRRGDLMREPFLIWTAEHVSDPSAEQSNERMPITVALSQWTPPAPYDEGDGRRHIKQLLDKRFQRVLSKVLREHRRTLSAAHKNRAQVAGTTTESSNTVGGVLGAMSPEEFADVRVGGGMRAAALPKVQSRGESPDDSKSAPDSDSRSAAAKMKNSAERKPKRSTEKGEARRKLIAALTLHHMYSNGHCLNCEPIGNNALAKLAEVASSSASDFFTDKFDGHAKYRAQCNRPDRLAAGLKALNGEFQPRDFYNARTPEEVEQQRDREDE